VFIDTYIAFLEDLQGAIVFCQCGDAILYSFWSE
jgi:hypothetical protein